MSALGRSALLDAYEAQKDAYRLMKEACEQLKAERDHYFTCFKNACEEWTEELTETNALLDKLASALEFECGNRCAHQNPCNAREALESYKAWKGEK